MTELMLSRRALYGMLAGAAGLAAFGSAAAPASPAAAAGTDGLPPLQRFMKVYASLSAGPLWYWYSGVIEMAPAGAPVIPLIGIETLIRRDVRVNPDGTFTVLTAEANYFHDLADLRPIDRIVNPATGRSVQPLHFSEGPRTSLWSDTSLAPRRTGDIETSISWREAGPYTWLHRTLHADTPHPLNVGKWPLEASGPRNVTGSFSTHCALRQDIADPGQASAPCSFTYEAIFGWLPWLLMGQRPGQLLWRATGLKLPTLDGLPAAARAGFDATFPQISSGAPFGAGGGNLWERFQATRTPASR